VTVLSQNATVTSAEAEVSAEAATTVSFDLFYFPGWQAAVDGEPAGVMPSHPHGFITVPVPAGRHTVAVWFGSTPLRAATAAVSVLAVGVVAGLVGNSIVKRQPADFADQRRGEGPATAIRRATAQGDGTAAPATGMAEGRAADAWQAYGPAAVLAVLLAVRVIGLDGRESIFSRTRFDGAGVAGVDAALDVNFDDQLVLLGYDAPGLAMAADGQLPVTLYWRAQNLPEADYSTTIQVLDAGGNRWGQADSQHPGRVPTSRWRADQYAADAHSLELVDGAPPGEYGLFVGVYQVDGPALSVLDAERAPRGPLHRLGTLMVTERQGEPRPLGDAVRNAYDLGPLTLHSAEIQPVALRAGSEATWEVFWTANGAARPAVLARWELLDARGRVLTVLNTPPAHTGWPTAEWPEGEVVRGVYRLRAPADAPAGAGSIRVSLVDAVTSELLSGPADVLSFTITTPERTFDAPPMDQRLEAAIGGSVVLLGYDVETASGSVTIYWQASRLLDESYTGFVHALAVDGSLLAQRDQLPAGGARPTTGWLPGEVIADRYVLPLEGAATLRAGLYDPQTGERLGEAVMPIP
jgi:hypothetical protein